MFKHVLVPATGAASDTAVFATALLAARPFGAHLEFLHVRVDVGEVVVAMSAGGVGGGAAMQGIVDKLEEENKAQEQKALAAFSSFCTNAGIAAGAEPGTGLSAEIAVETGSEPQWLAEYGRFTDLVVVGRSREGEDVAMDVLEAALMDTGRPLLIAPPAAPAALLDCVVIAWKDSPEAARAVSAAMPFIDRAKRVVILSVHEDEKTREETSARLLRSLRWHNPATTVRSVDRGDRPAVEALLDGAKALDASLLVMGGYSHSRLREVVFGGFTQRILNGADIPVLLAH